MKNFYLVATLALFLAACDNSSSKKDTTEPPVADTTAPVVTAPDSITVAAVDSAGTPASDAAIAAFLTGGSANDDVDGSVDVSTDAPASFPLGDTTVTFSASDAAGNAGTSTATVSITDQAVPVLTAPADISVTAASGAGVAASDATIAAFLAGAVATDNVDSAITVTNDAPTTFPVGATTVTFSASDAASNAAVSVTAVVTVESEVQAGNAVKGPLYLAKVFFDYDGNGEHDSDEPSTLTAADGSYTLAEDSSAPESYQVVVEMTDDTVDSSTGESYADSDVSLKAPEGGSVVSPMTALYSHALTSVAGAETLTADDLAAVLGLPAGIDILTYNQFADGVDADDALAVEKVAQKVMLAAQMITEAVEGSGSSAIPAALAREAAFDALVKTVVEVNKIRNGGTSETVSSATGLVDFADPLILDEIAEFVEEDIASGDLAAGLAAAGITVDANVATYVLAKNSATIAKIAAKVDTLVVGDLGGVAAAAISQLKHAAAVEIFNTSTAAVAFVTAGSVLDTFDETLYLTLNTDAAIDSVVEEAENEAEGYLVEQLNLVDTDDDGKPDVCDTACLSFGLTEDLDDDGDTVLDLVDAFPLDATESLDSDGDGIGNNADTDDDNDGVIDTLDAFRLALGTVTLNDYNPADKTTVSNRFNTTLASGVLSVDMRSAPLSLVNMQNALTGGDFATPTLSMSLSSLPVGSGTDLVVFTLLDGADSTQGSGERKVSLTVSVDWESDGELATVTVPGQTATVTYENTAGVATEIEIANVDADILTITSNGPTYPATLDIKLVSVLTKLSGLPLSSLITEGVFNVQVETSLPLVSSAGVAVNNVAATIEISDPFKLAGSTVTLTDYHPLAGETVSNKLSTTLIDSVLSVDLRSAPLNLLNMQNAISGDDFQTPVLSFDLANLPTASGTDTVSISLVDGLDTSRDSGERSVTLGLSIAWESDDSDATITVPAQTITASYTTADGVVTELEVANVESDVLTVTSAGADTPATLDVKLLALISKLSSLPLSSILDAGLFNVQLETSLPLISAGGLSVDSLSAIVEISDAFQLAGSTVTLVDYDAVKLASVSSTLTTTLTDGVLAVDLRTAPLNLENIENAISGDDFTTPVLSFELSSLPAGTGTGSVSFVLLDGSDATQDSGERKVSVDLDVEWDSDGASASITVPAQTLDVSYETKDGTSVDVAVSNLDADLLSVTSAGVDYPATLDIKLMAAITKLSSLPLSSLLEAGTYNIQMTTDLPLSASDGTAVTGLSAIIDIRASGDMSGFVVKGPLHKAMVFFDYDGDGALSEGEPSTYTNEDGSYELSEGDDAPADYTVVVVMGEDTIDNMSGESYADSGVTLKASSDSAMMTPMTTLLEHGDQAADEEDAASSATATRSKGRLTRYASDNDLGEFTIADYSAAMGLPESVNILTYNTHAEGADPEVAHKVETISQHLMTTTQMVMAAIKGSGTPPEPAAAAKLVLTLDVGDSSPDAVRLTGPWWGWDPAGGPEAEANEDGTWGIVLDPIPADNMEYLWVVDGAQENLIDNAAAGECSDKVDAGAFVTDFANYANRKWLMTSGDVKDAHESCADLSSAAVTQVAVSDEIAHDVALDAVVRLLIEVVSLQAGEGSADVANIDGALDLADETHLEELEEFIEEDLSEGALADALTASGATVPFDVLEFVLEHSSSMIARVASEFDKLDADGFGGIEAAAVSIIKHDAAEQIFNMAAAARSYYDANGMIDGFDESGYIVFDDQAAIDTRLLEAEDEVRSHLIEKLGLTDSDSDGLPDECNAECVDAGLKQDPDTVVPATTLALTLSVGDSTPAEVRITGPWWSWDPAGGPAATVNTDGTWGVVLDPIPTDNMEYLWVVDGVQENLIDNAAAGECSDKVDATAFVTDYANYANRKWLLESGDAQDVYDACSSL